MSCNVNVCVRVKGPNPCQSDHRVPSDQSGCPKKDYLRQPATFLGLNYRKHISRNTTSAAVAFPIQFSVWSVSRSIRLPLAPASVLSVASHTNAKSLHAFWPIRTPHSNCANQDAWAVITLKWPKTNFDTRRRVTLTHTRLTQHHARRCIFSIISFRPHYLSLASVPFSFWDRPRVTSYSLSSLNIKTSKAKSMAIWPPFHANGLISCSMSAT